MKTIEQILQIIKNSTRISARQIVKKTGLSRQIIHRHLKKLYEENLIKKQGAPPRVFYFLKKNQKPDFNEIKKQSIRNLKPNQCKINKNIDKARRLVSDRNLIWYSNPKKLSSSSIVEHVFSNGDFEDFQEILRLFGKEKVKEIFTRQINKSKINYRPITINFFKHYFQLNA